MSITTPHRFVRPRRDRRNESGAVWLQMAAALFGGMLLFLAVVFTLSMGYNLAYFGRSFPGVSVAGVDVSGMSLDDAAVKLNSVLTYPYSGRIVFRDGANVWMETPAQLGMVFDPAATSRAALEFGRSGNLFQNVNDQLIAVQWGVDLPPINLYDERIAHTYLRDLATQIDRPVAEASLNINGLDVTAKPGQAGRLLNIDSTLVYLNAQMQAFRDGEVPLVITEKAPEVLDSSMQAETARRLLSAPFTLSIPDGLPGGLGPWQIQPKELAAMLRVGRVDVGNPNSPGMGGTQFVLQLDRAALQAVLEQIAKQVNHRSEDARFIFDDKTLQVELIQPAIIGLTMDVPDSIEQVEYAVAQGQQNAILNVSANQPQVGDAATAQQLGITGNIQTYTTYFRGSTTARMQNIQAAAAKFHGLLVAPGATFSMGKYIGDISLDNGFAEALIIYNGQTIKGVGGGVCQVSTTLFRAVFFAGFPIVERHAHAYRVSYYEETAKGVDPFNLVGLDATVYFPLVDFKFTNDSPHWLLMETYYSAKSYSLTWKLYSTYDGRTMTSETTGPINVIPAPQPVIRQADSLNAGEIKHVDFEANGADVIVNRIVMREGKIHFVDKFQTQYQPWADVCEYGPGTKDKDLKNKLKKNGWCQNE